MSDKPYSVHIKGSPWEADNDDLWCGEDFNSLDEALGCFDALAHGRAPEGWKNYHEAEFRGCYLILDSAERFLEQKLPGRRPRDDGDDWQRERAMEAGMLHGCDGYNDAMGY